MTTIFSLLVCLAAFLVCLMIYSSGKIAGAHEEIDRFELDRRRMVAAAEDAERALLRTRIALLGIKDREARAEMIDELAAELEIEVVPARWRMMPLLKDRN